MNLRSKKTLALIATLWDTAWKAAAIRAAARNGQHRWIVPLLITNSIGILPMLYLWRFQRPRDEPLG